MKNDRRSGRLFGKVRPITVKIEAVEKMPKARKP